MTSFGLFLRAGKVERVFEVSTLDNLIIIDDEGEQKALRKRKRKDNMHWKILPFIVIICSATHLLLSAWWHFASATLLMLGANWLYWEVA
jgi:hypothetical protein